MRCRSTASVTLKLTIPQIPHINFPFVFASFDDYAVFPEVGLDVWNRLLALEQHFAPIAKRVGIHRQQPLEITVFQPHPEKLTAHDAIDETKIAVLDAHHSDVIVIPIANHSRERVSV